MVGENSIETEYVNLTKNNDWYSLYQRIRAESRKSTSDTCQAANRPPNKALNRYRDVSPYDQSRVVLQRGPIDYINANVVPVERAQRCYILTQGPLSNTVTHFWLMVWEQNTRAVLMLNKLVEKRQEKCFRYWPRKIGPNDALDLSEVGLRVEYVRRQNYANYVIRTLRLTDTNTAQSRDILQFHYTTWPDFGVPTSPTAFLQFLRRVRRAGVLDSNVGPAVVHCSAGIGRSGTFCLVDTCLVLVEKFSVEAVNVKEVLLEMRKYRMGLIQTPEQLRFSYEAIIEGLNKGHRTAVTEQTNENRTSEDCETNEKDGDDEEDEDDEEEEEIDANDSDGSGDIGGDDDPPPLPPPRLDSLSKIPNGDLPPTLLAPPPTFDRPLPNIPNSVSLNDFETISANNDQAFVPSGPLPVVPADDEMEEDSDEDESEEIAEESSEDGDLSRQSAVNYPAAVTEEKSNSIEEQEEVEEKGSPSEATATELRHRKRMEMRAKLSKQINDMKRRQRSHEQWTQLKRAKKSTSVLQPQD